MAMFNSKLLNIVELSEGTMIHPSSWAKKTWIGIAYPSLVIIAIQVTNQFQAHSGPLRHSALTVWRIRFEKWCGSHSCHCKHLVGGAITILKNMSSSMGRMTSHILWKVKNVWNHQAVIFCRLPMLCPASFCVFREICRLQVGIAK